MGDFFQNGSVTTLHNLASDYDSEREKQLCEFAKKRPISLLLPSLYSELQGSALEHIVQELRQVSYINEIVIGLDRADISQYRHALKFFSRLPQKHKVLWNDGSRLKAIDERLKKEGLAPIEQGKGRNVWYCLGYILARNNCDVIALHDCDILTYSKEMLTRLIYPIANPGFNYEYCKGYYSRIALDLVQMHADDATLNGLKLDRHFEEQAVELFSGNILQAGAEFFEKPMETPFMPSWNRVVSAIPSIQQDLIQAVAEDNKNYG